VTGARPADPGTSIIGRDDELRAVAEAFATGARLVTLVGLGGIGKTTIALACSARRQHAESASGQTVFVDLAPLTDPSDVLTTIGAALGLTGSSAALLEEAVVRELRRSTPLLILDNFESVRAASRLVDRLMEAVPELTVLVTSRIAVGVRGEREVPVRALTVPTSTADLESAASGRLLLERAAERGGLRSSEAADREAMVEICRHLDGVPLAIELAAAWTRLLSPRAIVRRLVDDRLDLTVPDGGRHAGMDRVVDSTLALIRPEDRNAFEALAIFPAPFDEDDASAVLDAEDVLAVLRRLEAIGLIQPQSIPTASRGSGSSSPCEPSRRHALAADRTSARSRLASSRRRRAGLSSRPIACETCVRDGRSTG
jgi:predicted ATPase